MFISCWIQCVLSLTLRALHWHVFIFCLFAIRPPVRRVHHGCLPSRLFKVGEKHRELTAAKVRIEDLERDAERHAEAYATIVHKMRAAKASAEYDQSQRMQQGSSSLNANANALKHMQNDRRQEGVGRAVGAARGTEGSLVAQEQIGVKLPSEISAKVGLHELTHLKCAVLEYIRTDPEESARREQLTRMISTLLHFSAKEAESALAVARQRPSDSDPLAFLGAVF